MKIPTGMIFFRDPLMMMLKQMLVNPKLMLGYSRKKVSSKNSSRRGCLTMPHRTDSRPSRQIIWEDMGVKEGNDVPPISKVFKRTRKGRHGNLAEVEATKYVFDLSIRRISVQVSTCRFVVDLTNYL